MATTLTPNAQLRKPAVADRNWDVPLNANADFLDGVAAIGRLLVTPAEVPSASPRVRVTPGAYVRSDGTLVSFAGSAGYALPASSTVAVWLTDAGVLSSAADFPASPHVRLARVVTTASAVASVTDERVVLRTCLPTATDPPALTPSGVSTDANGLAPELVLDHVNHAVAFFGAAPATQAASVPALADGSTGAASDALVAAGASYSPAELNDNFAALAAKVNALIAALKRFGLMGQ